MRFKINKDGSVEAVYSDKLRELKLGPMEVTRASNVEFNQTTQCWEARTVAGSLITSGSSREQVVKDEVEMLESKL